MLKLFNLIKLFKKKPIPVQVWYVQKVDTSPTK